jgi:demethylmenaquinone methyltransferase/2-methoxy-6-polyprenyl-1,4-benzoquinol methylase
MDTLEYMQALISSNPLRESILKAAIATLNLPAGSSGLDAGCGVGLQSMLLARAVGSAGHVIGLDATPEFLEKGEEIVNNAGLADCISFKEGDVGKLPFDDNTFDWLWSSDCVGYAPWEPVSLMAEQARVVKPGGIVAIAAWSSERLLPGYPELEAKLGATSVGLAPFEPGKAPESHFLRALGWFRGLGFTELEAEVFAENLGSSKRQDAQFTHLPV